MGNKGLSFCYILIACSTFLLFCLRKIPSDISRTPCVFRVHLASVRRSVMGGCGRFGKFRVVYYFGLSLQYLVSKCF